MSNSLTTADYWEKEFWQLGSDAVPDLSFDPLHPEFCDLHSFLTGHLPSDENLQFVELGCHPGRFLWYFHSEFGYAVSGVEYVESCCAVTKRALAQANVPGRVHHADVFTFIPPDDALYDVVASFGLVEHFRDITPIVARHAALLAPGGWLVITVPNHRGLNGTVFRRILPEQYALHNQMSYGQLEQAVRFQTDLEIVAGGHLGRFNLAPTNFCPWARERTGPRTYAWIDRLHRWGMNGSRWLPNSRWWSPYLGIIARKSIHSPEDDTPPE